MNIKIKLRQDVYRKSQKPDPQDLIRNASYTFCNRSVGGVYRNNDNMYMFHYEKHNKKVISRKRTKAEICIYPTHTVSKIEPAYWKITVTIIPHEVLKLMNKKVKQNLRNWEFV
jgi:hypothetical protein